MRFKVAAGLAIATMTLLGAGAAKNDAESLQGTWRLASGEANGKPLSNDQLKGGELAIEGDHYAVTLANCQAVTGTQLLGAARELKTIDITDDAGANKGKTCLGIYELKGNEFRVIFSPPGKARPSKFVTMPESGQWMHAWKRAKS
jgi:uncharacterized protein (TIGR03067 family)